MRCVLVMSTVVGSDLDGIDLEFGLTMSFFELFSRQKTRNLYFLVAEKVSRVSGYF